ncbi:MAG TPA: hypothetical protein VKS80_10655 [Trinickia sp.]|nr:hypothetical protein [Trinickia sp.]
MKTRDQLDDARQIAHIRTLQLERARVEAQRLAHQLREAKARERAAEDDLNAHWHAMRQVLDGPAALSPELLHNWTGAAAAARNAHALAAEQAQAAAREVEAFRPTLGQHQRQLDLAESIADRARRRHDHACEDAHSAKIEDLFLSHGGRR